MPSSYTASLAGSEYLTTPYAQQGMPTLSAILHTAAYTHRGINLTSRDTVLMVLLLIRLYFLITRT